MFYVNYINDLCKIVVSGNVTGFGLTASTDTLILQNTIEEDGYYYCEGSVTIIGMTTSNRFLSRLYSDDKDLSLELSVENGYPTTYRSNSLSSIVFLEKGTKVSLSSYSFETTQHASNYATLKIIKLK